ncbi:MAG TPA: DNA ligase D [Noviherbaspirillum sp.]|nr:DNA ligase D [Noviherbaspirillum sp.]
MSGKLSTYHAKRNFRITPEPAGAVAASTDRLRFVVQKHDARRLHYDFRLEFDGTLKSWAVPKGPSLDPSEKRLAVHVEDHPLDYIDFEGDIPEHQYGAGHVDVWDTGYWEPLGDPLAGYKAGKMKFRLHGEKLHGGWTLLRTRLQARGNKEQWLLIKEKDDGARPIAEFDVTAGVPDRTGTNTDTGRPGSEGSPSALPHAIRKPLPETLKPQLATLVDAIPQSGDWTYEIKYDGYRLLARIDDGDVALFTRDGKDWTPKLPQQAKALAALRVKSAWLDGEIVVLDKHGVPSFQLLQNAFDQHGTAQIIYFVFDILYLDGYDLRATPLSQRRRLLQQLMTQLMQQKADDDVLRLSMPLEQAPQKLLAGACRMSMEGIIGKRSDSLYTGERSNDWIKLKCRARQEFVIAGYTEPQGTRKFFGALLLGVFDDDSNLRYAGKVGTGFDQNSLHAIYKQLKPLEQEKPPFPQTPAGIPRAHVHWVKPSLVAEVSFAEWTQDGLVRQAVFDGIRADKPAREIQREQAVHTSEKRTRAKAGVSDNIVQGVRITHPERIVDPESSCTKLELVRYYDAVAPWILPFLQHRPVYLLRCPEGVHGEQFFQKHSSRIVIPSITMLPPELDPGHAPLMAIESIAALVGAAQMGSIELHSCNATADKFDRPDCMVFDLDPDPALPWQSVAEGARLTKVVLDELGLCSFLKTSGGKGLHLVVPLSRRQGWDEVAAFSQAVAQHLAHMLPRLFSAKMGEKNRVGKIFVDYLRNRRQASTVVPYSVRARPGLPVATPIAWDELEQVTSAAMWTIASLPGRLARNMGDPWQEFFATRQSLTAAMKRKLGMATK